MRLDSPRVIGLVASGLVLAGWLLGSTLSPPVARTQERDAARAVGTRSAADDRAAARRHRRAAARRADTDAESVRLRARRDGDAGRGRRRSKRPNRPRRWRPTRSCRPREPEWRLVGVAVDAAGTVTAIVSGAGDVHLVRSGDRLPGEVAVIEVTSDGVRLERLDGTTLDLRLP